MKTDATWTTWENNTHHLWWKDPGLRLQTICAGVLFLGIYTAGYDASYLTGLQAMSTWSNYFGHPAGSKLGFATAAYYFPSFIAAPIMPTLCDYFGRKKVMILGCLFIIGGAFVGAFAHNYGQLIGGRCLVGAGSVACYVSTICLCQEICHPRLRGYTAALQHSVYYIGSIVSAWLVFGLAKRQTDIGDWAWRAPTLVQAFTPTIIIISALTFLPESPRWFVYKGRREEALTLLAKLHANGRKDDELVVNEMREIETAIELEKQNNTTWLALINSPAARRRTFVLIIIATGTQWLGQGILSYYLSPVLKSLGITGTTEITAFNGGLAIWNWLSASAGAMTVERLGRRKLWLIGTGGFLCAYAIFMALSAEFAKTGATGVGRAAVFIIFIVYFFYNASWIPLTYSYVAEICPYTIRAKGVALTQLVGSMASAFNQYVNPIAFGAIKWKFYGVYLVLDAIYLVLIYFLFPETRGYTVEELGHIFDKNDTSQSSMIALAECGNSSDAVGTSLEATPNKNKEIALDTDTKV